MESQKSICRMSFEPKSEVNSALVSALINRWVELAEAVEQRLETKKGEKILWSLMLWGDGTDGNPFHFYTEVSLCELVPAIVGMDMGSRTAVALDKATINNTYILENEYRQKGSEAMTVEELAEIIARNLDIIANDIQS